MRVPVLLAALSAIGIILGKFLAFNITEFMRFSLENTSILFVGIVFGPALGGLVGAVQDLVGCIAVGYAINPILTLGYVATGMISGAVFKLTKKVSPVISITLSVLSAHLVGSVLIKSVGLSVFYSLPFGATAMWRLLNYVIVGAVESFLLCLILKSKQILTQINKITPFSINKKFKSSEEATAYAKNISGVFSKPGLDRVTRLLSATGSPESNVRVVHIAGTNGKGSVAAMLSSVLTASGLKVGTFTSPYLLEMRESIRIDTHPISEVELISLFERLRPIADAQEDKPTEFELLTAAAYLCFAEADVDVAVIECGMGGRRDATNVIDSPLLSIITGISVDHTSFLGNTAGEIAAEKSGIIKHGCPVLVGNTSDDALSVIRAYADTKGAPLYFPDTPVVNSMTLDGTLIDCGGIENIKLSLLGDYQPRNAALVIKAATLLREHFPSVTDENIRVGLANAKWRGRFEVISEEPVFIFDGAHNLDGIKNAVKSVESYFGTKVVCLTGVLADKEYEAMADEIAKVAGKAVTVTPDSKRALSSTEWARVLAERGITAEASQTVSDGVRAAFKMAKENGLPVVCLGSLYLYGDVAKALSNVVNDK